MTGKEKYNELLKTPEWQAKRLKILDRDNHKCRKCNAKGKLHVHHKFYIKGKKPWQVPNNYLITLCEVCHEKEHKDRPIQTFIKSKKMSAKEKKAHNKKYAKSQNKSYLTQAFNKLSKEDKELQKRYDKLKGKLYLR